MADRIRAFTSRTHRYNTIYQAEITLLYPFDMARRGRFHVLPADDTYPIEDFDMFKSESKAKEPRRVAQHVS